MRYTTYAKYLAGLADQVNLQALLDQLGDFLLQSGFKGMPAWWGDPATTTPTAPWTTSARPSSGR